MSVTMQIRGLDELKAALANLPTELKGKATAIVLDAAHAAKDDIVEQYPARSGVLRKGVKVKVEEIGPHGVGAKVRSAAPHGWLYEHGSEARHYYSKRGIRHYTGRMPGKKVFIPTMIRHRRAMYAKLAAIIEAQGLTVKRDDAAV